MSLKRSAGLSLPRRGRGEPRMAGNWNGVERKSDAKRYVWCCGEVECNEIQRTRQEKQEMHVARIEARSKREAAFGKV